VEIFMSESKQEEGKTAPVSVVQKSSWALGSVADVYMTNALNYLAHPIYNMGLGVDPRMLGWALGLPRIWDAISDPLMGHISDNTRSRWGRRKPFIFVGAILCMIMFVAIWNPPKSLSVEGLGWYFLVATFLYYTAYTIFLVPWGALGMELTSDYHERTQVQAFKTVFQAVGGLGLGTMWLLAQKWGDGDDVVGVGIVGWVFGSLILICGMMSAIFCKEEVGGTQHEKMAFWPSIKSTFSNRVFLILVGATIFLMLGIFMVNSFAKYINVYYVYGGNKESVAKLDMYANFAFQGAGIALIPAITALSRRIGKKRTLITGLCMVSVAYGTSWFCYTPNYPYLQLVTLALAAPGLSCMWTLASAMMADICDMDELATGRRREGMFGASYSWACKAGISITMIMSGYMLQWSGFDAAIEVQPEAVITNMRLLYMIVPVLFVGTAALLVAFYPLTEEKVKEIQAELKAKAALA
jgi:glycoside/pentoside/hexuronide:cation symporter, GPH family